MRIKKKIIKIWITMLVLGTMLMAPVTRSIADTKENWHGFKGDSGHTGFIDQKMDRKLGMQWRFFFGGDYIEPIQVFSDNIYFLDRSGFLYSLKREDSTVVYKVSVVTNRTIIGLDASENYIFVVTGPAFARDRRNPGETSCIISAFKRTSGEKIWEKKYSTFMASSPVIVGDYVYFATGSVDPNFTKTVGGDLYCLNGSDGEEIFVSHVEEYAFGMGQGYITIADDVAIISGMKFDRTTRSQLPPKLFAINAKTGSQLWTDTPTDENKTFGIPAVKNGFVYIMENPAGGGRGGPGGGGPPGGGDRPPGGGGPGGSRQTPEAWLLKMELKTGKNVGSMNIQNENFGNFSPTLAQDAIYINSFTGKIYCIDYEMSKIYWTKTYDRFSFYTELTATQNYLYTCLYDGTFLCISKEDGSIQYRYTVGNYGGIPVVSGSEIFVSGEALYCFSLNAKPLLLTEPSALDFKTLQKGVIKQLSFRVLYTGIESLSGTVSSDVSWITIKPELIAGNIQTFFALIDSTKVPDGKQNATIFVNTNMGNKTISVAIEIKVPTPLPLSVNIKDNSMITNQNRFILEGSTDPLTRILINGLEIFATNRGQFTHEVALHEGNNPIQIEAISKDNRKSSLDCQIKLDSIPPSLEATLIKVQDQYLLQGKTDPDAIIWIGDKSYNPATDGTFKISLTIPPDQSELILVVKDIAGNVTTRNLSTKGE
jgi:outer membrane protein assembly factor BamB